MRSSTIFILILVCSFPFCFAEPDLDHFQDIEKTRIYRDNKDPDLWYISPAKFRVKQRAEGTPDYSLVLYRYLGRKGTGDSGNFWARGVLTLWLDRSHEPGFAAKVRRELAFQGISSPRLKTAPVSDSTITLLFADIDDSRKYGMRWKSGPLSISLDPARSMILWDSIEAGQSQVSIVLDETVSGVRKHSDGWMPSTADFFFVLPLEMDFRKHPDNFERIDLGGRMNIGYTGLDIFCFDFIENLENDLYAKIVEVAIPAPGRDLVETVTFKAGGDCRRRIEFKLAKEIDQPYRFRITRIFLDGQKKTEEWQEKSGEAMLDITAYINTDETVEESQDKSSIHD